MASSIESNLKELIALLEADIPANPSAPKNDRLAKQLERELTRYFLQLSAVIPIEQIDALYYKNVRQD